MGGYFGNLQRVCTEKWEKLDRILSAAEIDVLVANDLSAVRYLTGYLPYLTLSPAQGQPAVYERGRGRPILYPLPYYAEFARARFPWLEVRCLPDGVEAVAREVARACARDGRRGLRVGCCGATSKLDRAITQACREHEIVEGDAVLAEARAVKTPGEIALLRDAVRIAEAGMTETIRTLDAGITECQVAAEGERLMRRLGTESHVIALRGCNAAILQEVSTDDVFAAGDLALLDLGCYRAGYRAEFARTVVVKVAPNRRQREMLEAVSRALSEAAALLLPGTPCGVPAAQTTAVIREAGFGEYAHSYPVGHGLGVSGGEHPLLVPGSEVVLEENMVVTLEPGIFIPSEGVGVRIEDIWLVRQGGPERLTSSLPYVL